MDALDVIAECLISVHVRLMATCKDLTKEHLCWRPVPTANNIGFILWHMSRHQDTQITKATRDKDDVWITDSWYQRFSQSPNSPDPGDRMGLRSLSIPPLNVLLGYSEAVHDRNIEYVSHLDANELDQPVSLDRPIYTVGNCLRHLITHQNNHHGQIDYIRGLQDETWNLPVGTGVIVN